ncbi:putative F420-0 ABC transporter substrate-binding protein [Nocardioides sp. Bht2]|uniref:putative F420-0 ABC transporter substrate-binding protein n=1 Tax=Nocardioides sp. Bht2 TaxID=3392297 RepID=UPI0039B6A0BE
MNRLSRHAFALPAVVLLGAALLTGCAEDKKPETSSGDAVGYPIDVDNCGTPVKLDAAPQRIVTIKSSSTELALALGLGDRIVGTAFSDGPLLDAYASEGAALKNLSDQAPSKEVVLEAEPDFVFAGWESNLAADTAGKRDDLAKLGVASYVAPSACQAPEYQPKKMTFDLLFDQFREAGQVFGVADRAEALISEQEKELAKVQKAVAGTTALWWSSGEDTPFVGGTIGAPQMVLDAVGLENIVTTKSTWTSYGWESIVDADPDVIVLVDAAWNPAAAKIKTLESSAATKNLSAVKAKRYLVIPFPAAEAGVRSVAAAGDLASQLETLGLLED